MFSLAFLAMTLLPAPAHADGWLLTYSATGTETTTPFDPTPASGQTFSDSASGTNTVASTKNWTSGVGFPGGATTSMTITVTVKGTWMGSDPVPPSVMVIETVHLDQDGANDDGSLATGTFDDTFGDQPVVVWRNNGKFDQTCGTPAGIPIAHQTTKSGSSFTITDTFKASSSATTHESGSCSAAAHFDGYTATIHAQPYNFRRVPGQGKIGIDGNIDWVYDYSSTDGNPNDLTTCTWHEHLTYPDGQVGTQAAPNKYYPPSPPFGYPASGTAWFPNPDFGTDVSLVPNPAGSAPEIDDITYVPAFLKPYTYGTFSTTQVFEFNDSATGEKNVQIPGPDSGPFTIVRTVKYVDPTHYEYDVSKASVPNTLSLPD